MFGLGCGWVSNLSAKSNRKTKTFIHIVHRDHTRRLHQIGPTLERMRNMGFGPGRDPPGWGAAKTQLSAALVGTAIRSSESNFDSIFGGFSERYLSTLDGSKTMFVSQRPKGWATSRSAQPLPW